MVNSFNTYLEMGMLQEQKFGRGIAWLDTGTHDKLRQAANCIHTIEERQGLKVACLEEIAYRMKHIDAGQVEELAQPLAKTEYGRYLFNLLRKDNINR